MKINKFRNKESRLQIVLDIINELKRFPKSHPTPGESPFVDLYNLEYSAIKKLKSIFTEYIQQDDSKPNQLIGFSGKLYFEEINRNIEYILPIKRHTNYVFVLKYIS